MRVRTASRNASVGGGRQSVGVGGPDIDGCDLVAETADEPTKRCQPGFNGKGGVRLGEVPGRPSQRLRIARPRVGESDRLANRFASFAAANHLPSSPGV